MMVLLPRVQPAQREEQAGITSLRSHGSTVPRCFNSWEEEQGNLSLLSPDRDGTELH